jgi:radical SAM superfamily enzyme YgiQ (UPF0313 family)
MYDAGCRWLLLGLETGSAETRKRINKQMNHEMIREFVDKCTRVGISTFGSFIFGFPGETPEQLKETAQFALSLNLDAFLVNYFVLIPKTPICNQLLADGKIDISNLIGGENAFKQFQMLTNNYSEIPDKELKVVKSYFDWLSFTRKKAESQQQNMIFRKAIDALKHFAEGDLKTSVSNVYSAAKTFFTVIYYSHAFPKIIKKYGLYNVNTKK